MKRIAVVVSILGAGAILSGCLQKNTSFSNDARTFSQLSGSGQFVAAQGVFRQNCISCHANFASMKEDEFISARTELGQPLVVAGDPAASEIYIRLHAGSPRPQMPQNGSLSANDVAIIGRWIASLEATSPAPTQPKPFAPLRLPEPATLAGASPRSDAVVDMSTPKARFTAVKAIFSRPGSCATCHVSNFASFDESQMQSNKTKTGEPFVIAGQALASGLFKRLRGGGAGPMANMPPLGMPELSEGDIRIIRQWIDDMPTLGDATLAELSQKLREAPSIGSTLNRHRNELEAL